MSDNRINKSRYWWAVLYQENMIDGWQDKIADILQLPFCYCIHGLDRDSKSEHRKDHLHLIVVFSNTTTYKHAFNVLDQLSAPGRKALNKIEACVNIRHCYDYLIHDTDSCKKAGKELYPKECRISGNNFDIGCYEQITQQQRLDWLQDLIEYCIEKKFCNMTDFYIGVSQNFEIEYLQIYVGYNSVLERICKGNYLKKEAEKEKAER